MIYNVVLVSGVQQSDSDMCIYIYVYIGTYIYTHTHIYILFQILFHYRSLQDIECSSLCYTLGLYCFTVYSKIDIVYLSMVVYSNVCMLIP